MPLSLLKTKYRATGKILMIPVEDIQPNPDQPRREFSYERLLGLAQSISENGMLNPITVTFQKEKPVLVAGERRLRAAKIAGIRQIPCIAVQAEGPHAALLTLIENLQRENMNCFEEAEGIQRLISTYGLTQEETSNQLGCAQCTVANRLRLLRLTSEEQRLIIGAELTERHARALLRIDNEEMRMTALQRIIRGKLNVAQSEHLVEDMLKNFENTEKRKKAIPVIRDVRLFMNTVNHAVDTMRRSGIEASAEKTETEEYIEYLVRIPKGKTTTGSTKISHIDTISARVHA